MSSQLEVQKIEILGPSTYLMPHTLNKQEIEIIEVNISMTNKSKTKSFYVISKITQLIYDSAARDLTINLSTIREQHPRRNPNLKPLGFHRIIPPTIEVKPGQTDTINLRVPIKIKRFVGIENGKVKFETSDISHLRHIIVKIGFGEVPFSHQGPTKNIDELKKYFESWGEIVTKKFDVKIPGKTETKMNSGAQGEENGLSL